MHHLLSDSYLPSIQMSSRKVAVTDTVFTKVNQTVPRLARQLILSIKDNNHPRARVVVDDLCR